VLISNCADKLFGSINYLILGGREMKNFLRVISIVMVFALLIQIMPMSLIAKAVTAPTEEISSDSSSNPITGECKELRDTYTKVFERKDGSKIAIVSPEAIHYKKDGKFVDIDNTMVKSGKLGNKVLTNKDNALGVELTTTLNEDKQIKVTNAGYTLSFKFLENLNSASAHIEKQQAVNTDDNQDVSEQAYEKSGLDNKDSAIKYSNIMDNVDAEYVVQPEKLKENIILKEKPTEDVSFSYSITASGLTAKVNKDNSINFYAGTNKKTLIFILPAPVMFDSNNISSSDIQVILNKETDGTYTMTYVPSMTWLNSTDTGYPVTVDPVISTPKVSNAVQDSYVSSDNQTTNYGTSTELLLRNNSEVPLVRLTMINLAYDSVITKANVYLYNNTENGTGNCAVAAKGITTGGSWTETSVDWEDYAAMTKTNTVDLQTVDLSSPGYVSWDITKLMKSWRSNNTVLNGMVFETESTTAQDVSFASSENENSSIRPYFTIEYRSVAGVSTGLANHSQTIGRAGTVYVNDYSGALTIERTDMSFGGKNTPIDLTWYYNSYLGLNNYGYGCGIENSYSENLIYIPVSPINKTAYYMLKYGDGSTHYLDVLPAPVPADPNAPNVRDEQTGEEFIIKAITVGENTEYTLTDNETTMKYFSDSASEYLTYCYLCKTESVQTERLTHVAVVHEDTVNNISADPEHFEVRFNDGIDRRLDIIETKNDIVTVEDKETGLQYTIAQITENDNTGYKLTDSTGAEKYYISPDTNTDTTKFLYQTTIGETTTEAENNIIEINIYPTDGRIDNIVDGAGRTYVFNYNTSHKLTSVDYMGTGTTALYTVSYDYDSSGRLNTVTFPDSKQAKYEWIVENNENKLKVSNVDDAAMEYTYVDDTIPLQVTKIQEIGNDGETHGNYIDITYDVDQTTFTDNAGNKQIESFDQYGNVVTTQDKDGYATFSSYGENSGKGQNLLLGQSDPQRTTVNLMKNGGFENSSENSPIALQDPVTGVTETPFFSDTANPAYAGNNCYKVSCGSNLGGYAVGTVAGLTDGKLYSVSLWIRTVGENAKARIILLDGENVTDACPYTSTDGKWQYLQNVCVSVSGSATVYIDVENGSSTGSADFYIDNIQFERAVPATSFNFIDNSNFSESGNPHWTIPTSATVGSYPTNYTGVPSKLLGSRLEITGSATDAISATQSININGKAGQTYTFGGWASAADALPSGDSNSGRSLSISIVKPAVGQDPEEELARIDYNTYVTNWQFQESSFTLDKDCSSVEIRLNYNHQLGTAYFDGIEFFKDGLYKDFNSSGDIVNTSDAPDTTAQTSQANESGVTSTSETDRYGNVTKSYSTNGQVKIQQSSTYTSDGNYLTSSTDELGNTTGYTYNTTAHPNNEQLGLVSSITDAKNDVINYAYNSMMQKTSVSQTVTNPYGETTSLNLSTSYTYNDSDKPSEITAANGTQYHFTYTIWGDISTVSVGTTILASYNYDNNPERKLHKINYANARNFFIYRWQDERGIDVEAYGYCIGSDDQPRLILGMYKNDFGVPFMLVDGDNNCYVDRDGITVEFAYDDNGANIIHSYGQKDRKR
jgi:YD repeat-containing protein